MQLQHHGSLSVALWVGSVGLMLVGTFMPHGDNTLLFWGLVTSAAASTASITYFVRKERMRIGAIIGCYEEQQHRNALHSVR